MLQIDAMRLLIAKMHLERSIPSASQLLHLACTRRQATNAAIDLADVLPFVGTLRADSSLKQ